MGTIGKDHRGDALNVQPPAVVIAIDHRAARTDVRCQCGKVKSWYGGRVVLPRR